MSYNYDLNPWDDTPPSQGAASNQYHQTSQGTGNYGANTTGDAYSASGYSNPAAQYGVQDAWNNDQYNSYATDQQQGHTDEYADQQQQQQEQYQQEQEPQGSPPSQPGFISRFLRARVPLCGTCMDISSPILDALLKYVNRDLLASKIFYFFFYSAFGSLFPLMGVYFKQLGMNPAQVGILTGVRPIIEIFSAPFWNSLAERFKKSKLILLFSLLSWIVFTYSLAHIRPPASACIAFNNTDFTLYTPYSDNDLSNYDVGQLESEESPSPETEAAGGGGGVTRENEMFMSKVPQAVKKDEILIKEETVVNDQGKRRRRRRKRSYNQARMVYEQIPRPSSTREQRYIYSSDADADADAASQRAEQGDEGYASQLDIDLENDFEDTALARSKRSSEGAGGGGDENGETLGDERGQASAEHERDDEMRGGEGEGEEDSERRSRMGTEETNGGGGGNDDDEGENQAEEDNEIIGKQRKESKLKHQEHSSEESESRASDKVQEAPTSQAKENQGEQQQQEEEEQQQGVNKTKRIFKQRHKTPPTHIVGMSPITVEYAANYNREKHGQFVTPMFSTIVYKLDDIKEVFFLLLLLISLGEFFSAPAITIADSTTLSCLGENTDLYGRQRMFGSIGWAITLLLVGMALDNSKTIADHPCGPHQRERSYHVCFTIFSLLMGCAFVTATQFKFNYTTKTSDSRQSQGNQVLVTKKEDDNTVTTTTVTVDTINSAANIDDVYASTRPREIFNTAPPVNAPPPSGKEKFEFLDKWKSAVFAQSTWEPPEWVGVFRQFKNTMHLTYLFITWFLGCGVGLVFTFLFWHLQDVGGTPTLFGICSVINHISEILAYFFSSFFIKRYGHTKVLSVGLGCNVIRFLYVAFLSNPYYALPFELVQGITHAACFAACCSYMSHVSKPELKASTQGVMQGLHNGIGRACGALLGGYMINAIGSRASFCIYGLLSGCVLGGFLYARKKASADGDVKVIDDENLGNIGAPQGVPEKVSFRIRNAD